jgi:hypothetical protein
MFKSVLLVRVPRTSAMNRDPLADLPIAEPEVVLLSAGLECVGVNWPVHADASPYCFPLKVPLKWCPRMKRTKAPRRYVTRCPSRP